ncbi:peptidase M48 [Polaribacter pacificus]|uniref:Peptidase M48 n=1 Tax=Polaribacter pacificus TaxID=1775173 RepID=A0A917MFA7_9FLAO|nr:M48 family metallopeptidase [Polaribacter pacificus]GGH02005.1 peptidase M48 [Polaribacter pacificus]
MKRVIAIFLVSVLLAACSTVPITGRSRIIPVNDDQVLPASFAQYKGFLEENEKSKDIEKTNQIKNVGLKISAAVDRFMRTNKMTKEADSYKWEFNLIEDKTVNAWCLPGGKVVFYTGILPICANEDGIAAVMGHEVAHAFAKHGQERMRQGQIQALGGVAVALGTNGKSEQTQQIWSTVYGVGTGVGMLAYSREHESEADKLGLIFMIMAGYNGEEASEVWVRMSQQTGKSSQPEFLSTHPSNESRIKALKEYLPEAKKLAAKFNAVSLTKN